MVFYFRAKNIYQNKMLHVYCGDKEILKHPYATLKPPEMERLVSALEEESDIRFELEDLKSMKEYTCIVCPNGCSLHYDETTNTCTRQPLPARRQIRRKRVHNPVRSVTSRASKPACRAIR
jgi:hypothetical protein